MQSPVYGYTGPRRERVGTLPLRKKAAPHSIANEKTRRRIGRPAVQTNAPGFEVGRVEVSEVRAHAVRFARIHPRCAHDSPDPRLLLDGGSHPVKGPQVFAQGEGCSPNWWRRCAARSKEQSPRVSPRGSKRPAAECWAEPATASGAGSPTTPIDTVRRGNGPGKRSRPWRERLCFQGRTLEAPFRADWRRSKLPAKQVFDGFVHGKAGYFVEPCKCSRKQDCALKCGVSRVHAGFDGGAAKFEEFRERVVRPVSRLEHSRQPLRRGDAGEERRCIGKTRGTERFLAQGPGLRESFRKLHLRG